MTIQRMLELLEIEHECILRNSHDDCDRNCADCDLAQDDDELHEMYTDVIALLKEHEAVEPYSMNAERTYGICPKCGKIVFRYSNVEENHYCGICGQAVKWE